MSDAESFTDLHWPEFTEEDLQSIDTPEENIPEIERQEANDGAQIDLTGPTEATDRNNKSEEAYRDADESPFCRFRKRRGYLSVTDIVAPAWCEVQFDYGLRQLRNRPLRERPQSFTTKKGKEISVKVAVAAHNDRVLKKGKTVHRKLEKEIHKVEIAIEVATKEESWALRLLDLLSRLKSMKQTSVCREIPVWGVIHGRAVYGVIDELRLVPGTESHNLKRPASQDDQKQGSRSQANLDSFVVKSKNKMSVLPASPPVFILNVVDNKTRNSRSLPSHADTLPSRLQLMLYRLMLTQTLGISGDATTFSSFCSRTGVNPSRPFSDAFIVDMSALVLENELSLHFLDAKCIADMDFPCTESIKEMGLDVEGCVSKHLSLVYRLRSSSAKRLKMATSEASNEEPVKIRTGLHAPASVQEVSNDRDATIDDADAEVTTPVDGSISMVGPINLKNPAPRNTSESVEGSIPAAETSMDDDLVNGAGGALKKRKRSGSRTASTSTAKLSDETDIARNHESNTAPSKESSAVILGTKKFQYNAKLLENHLTSVLAWWNGERPPLGVSIEDSGRCNSCEYKIGCEWREQKALEVLEKISTKAAVDPTKKTS